MTDRKKQEFGLNVGTSSILFIFIILCLVSFAILSLSSAMSDYKLSERVVTNSESYYEACNTAEELLASFDDALSELYESGISRTGFYKQAGKKKTFAVPVTDIKTLNIEIKIIYPEAEGESFYEITAWQVETTGDFEYDESLRVYK